MEVTNETKAFEKLIDTFEIDGNKCRLCMKITNEGWQLFDVNNELPKKIMACAHVQIDENDGLPKIICLRCRQLLDVTFNFKTQVENSDAKLRHLYNLKTSSIEYEATAAQLNNSLTQSVNQVINETTVSGIKIHQDNLITDNLKNDINLTELSTSENDIGTTENHGCIVMINRLNNHNHVDKHDTISFNVDVNRDNCEDNKYHHNINGIIRGEENSEINDNEQIIVDISRVVTPINNVLVEKLEQFEVMKEENCLLDSEENELSDEDGIEIRRNTEIFMDTGGKVDVLATINEEIENYNEKMIREKNESNDNNDGDYEDDEDDNGDDDDNDNVDDDGGGNDDNDDSGGGGGGGDDDNNDDGDDDDVDEEEEEVKKNDEEKSPSSQTSSYKCLHCPKIFGSELTLQRHSTVHNNNKTKLRYVCYMCDKQFATVKKLKNHVLNTHNSLKNDTKNNDGNNEKTEEKTRVTSGKSDKKILKFVCEYCPKQFTYEKPFLTHAKRHPEYENQKQNKFMTITEELKSNSDDRERVCESDGDDMPFEGLQCTQCGKLFATKRNLTRHLSTHTGLKFNCTTCNKEFSRLDKLKEHEQVKHKNEFFGQSDDDDDNDSDNEIKANGSESPKKDKHNRPHKCPLCPKAFAQAQSLTNHMERHKRVKDTQKRFLCEVCSKCFAQSGSLVAHMRTHTGVKPYVCNVCNRAFTKSTYLQLHLRTHSGEKPYICQYCSRAFARANTLARHITMHTGEAKYHCQICMKSFRRLTSLNEHTYTHTGQRPYACKICTKRYNNAGSLYAHTKKCKIQQLTTNANNASFNNVTANDVKNQNDNGVTSMLIYSQRKISNDTTNVANIVNDHTTTTTATTTSPPPPSFMITNNVHNQKTPLTTNIMEQYTIEEPNIYTSNAKQFKNSYYTIYSDI